MSKKIAFKFFWINFTALYKTVPHDLLIKVLSEIINFVSKPKTRICIGFSKTSISRTSKGWGRRYFIRLTLTDAISFPIRKWYFTIGKLVLKQKIDISMRTDLASYWANLFLYFFEFKYVQQLLSKGSWRAYKFFVT